MPLLPLYRHIVQSHNLVYMIGATLLGFIAVMGVLLYSHHHQLRGLEATINDSRIAAQKMAIFSEQMELARSRTRLTSQIIDTSDPFEQDALNQELEGFAGHFASLVAELNTLPLTDDERQLLETQRKIILSILPAQRRAVEIAMLGAAQDAEQAKGVLYAQVMPGQGQLIQLFQQLIAQQQQRIDQLALESRQTAERAHQQQAVLAALTLLLATGITLIVMRRVHLIQQSQQRSHEELNQAVRERTSALNQARNMLQSVLDTIPVRVFWKDREGRYLGCNRLFALDAGVDDPRLLIGKRLEETLWAKEAGRYQQDDQRVIEERRLILNLELPQITTTGEQRWIELSKVPLTDEQGNAIGLLGCYQDITARHKAQQELTAALEQAHAANLAKSEFLSSMSHELRTPLNAILGFAQLLEMESTLAQEQRDNIQDILKAGNHLLDLINDVLDLSRIEAGRIDLLLEQVSLSELLDSCLKLIEPMALQRNITLHSDPASFNKICLHADYRRTRQVVINLLSNAVKYNRLGGEIFIAVTTTPAGQARLEIRDTGLGISAAKRAKLFTAFERLGAEVSSIEGTGIGLVITQQLLKHMGGDLGVESREGEGSTFWFELPLYQELQPAPEQAVECAPPSPPPHLATKSVLYIEDNPVNMKLVSKLLAKQTDLRLLTAEEPIAGLALAVAERPDVILLDINLPGMSGYEVLQQLRADPATMQIPVIALTANAMPEQVAKGREAGFDGYLTKPLNLQEFFATLHHHLSADRP